MGRELSQYKRTTQEERERMYKLKQMGISNVHIAQRFGVTPAWVATICSQVASEKEAQRTASLGPVAEAV